MRFNFEAYDKAFPREAEERKPIIKEEKMVEEIKEDDKPEEEDKEDG